MSDRCLNVLEELELENEELKRYVIGLEKMNYKLEEENKDLKDTINRFKASIEKYERSLD